MKHLIFSHVIDLPFQDSMTFFIPENDMHQNLICTVQSPFMLRAHHLGIICGYRVGHALIGKTQYTW